MDPKEIAARCGAVMQANDQASAWCAIRLDDIEPGGAVMSMTVEKHHLNGHGICHGGVIFMLADTAFAYACNSYNQSAVAQHNAITYIAPAHPDEILNATAREVSKTGRSGIYDVTVTGENQRLIAEFRGCSRLIKGQHFDEKEENHD